MQAVVPHNSRVQAFSLINLLVGVWLVILPFAFGERSYPLAASAVIAGALVIVSELVRYAARHTVALSWVVTIAGAWLIVAPWIFNAHSPGARTWSYVISGIVLAGISAYSITSSAFRHPSGPGGARDPEAGIKRRAEKTRRTIS
jgi:drug/metabolite transporter (DMT)-like permease